MIEFRHISADLGCDSYFSHDGIKFSFLLPFILLRFVDYSYP